MDFQKKNPTQRSMYLKEFEHDACGVGLICHTHNESSPELLQDGIRCLNNLNHRGAVGAEPNSGDGAGILFQVPHRFFQKEAGKLGLDLGEAWQYAVGQIFFPQHTESRETIRRLIEKTITKHGLSSLGWRIVPTDNHTLGASARFKEPVIEQIFIRRPPAMTDGLRFERKLFLVRRSIELAVRAMDLLEKDLFAIVSFSSRRIIYKGELIPDQIKPYFKDLSDPLMASPYVIFHSRFSTNTFPSWPLAHPYRYLAHNGEINTIRGNTNWMRSREADFETPLLSAKDVKGISPLIDQSASDTACLDNALELLLISGRSLPHALMMLMPEAWENDENISPENRAFFEYHAAFCEPWDGPAALCVTDGFRYVGAILDRNGLRPSRYTLYKDGVLVIGSETGLLDRPPADVETHGRLEPGKLLLADLEEKRLLFDNEIKSAVATAAPYREWIKQKIPLKNISKANLKRSPPLQRTQQRQQAFGYSEEELRMILSPMALTGGEPTGSMGSDTPLAVLSNLSHNLFNYFYQLFAQVTNPPIDPIREKSFMSLISFIGPQHNLLTQGPEHAHVIELPHPILSYAQIEKLRWVDERQFQAKTLNVLFKREDTPKVENRGRLLQTALTRLHRYVEEAINDGYKIVILSDRAMDSSHVAIPSLLALSSVHQHLVRRGKRSQVSLVVESGEVREVHHFALLLAYGANAICPYTALDTLGMILKEKLIPSEWPTTKKLPALAVAEANYIGAVCKGLLKVISKMGISTIRSYIGSQLFEAVGLSDDVIAEHFTGTVSRMGGIGLAEIEKETLHRHALAYPPPTQKSALPTSAHQKKFSLEIGGHYFWRQRGERHLFAPMTVHKLQQAVRTDNYDLYRAYADMVNTQNRHHATLRGLLDFAPAKSIPLAEVEPAEAIMKRFATGAMSYGSISWEAHTTLALAMNALGGKSNTGEGGEDPIRYETLPSGMSMRSAIKQVASGRFGVTSLYLTNADDIQIKIAQGAKPGEGGQLPGHKVDSIIARVRHSTEGVGLISPPPHHDIYSIEDLSQLIYDLKCANNRARVSVKLVSATGVGTIAAGVVKGYADHVVIAGYDGGTGASPLTSIKHAGLPWELGLSETHQTLIHNRLRSRVTIQTDGQIKTGRDIALATLLGAEEWGVATAALVAMGCIMMRKCHLNTCPVGVATQHKDLRKLFTGEVEHVIHFFHFLVRELREIMAELGFRKIEDMVGRMDRLRPAPTEHWKAHTLDWQRLLHIPRPFINDGATHTPYQSILQDRIINRSSDWPYVEEILSKIGLTTSKDDPKTDKDLRRAQQTLQTMPKMSFTKSIANTERCFGTLLSHRLTKILGQKKLKANTLTFHLKGVAGQSFAAFSIDGIHYILEGEANDYFGKGLSGSTLVLKKPLDASYAAHHNTAVGNVAFYGATSGRAYINGRAGERFCVRNSGVHAVVEGIGAHGCEYMTGGCVTVIGSIGKNFAAGMSGGIAYLYDENYSHPQSKTSTTTKKQNKKQGLQSLVNPEIVEFEDCTPADWTYLHKELLTHKKMTGSLRAKHILANWETQKKAFTKIMPVDYKRALLAKELEKAKRHPTPKLRKTRSLKNKPTAQGGPSKTQEPVLA